MKNYFIQKTCSDLKEGNHTVTHITREKFLKVFDGKFCRPNSLRQLVLHYKGAANREKITTEVLNPEPLIEARSFRSVSASTA